MASAGGDKGTRRRSRRRVGPATPAELGATLQRARTGLGLSLSEVHDRTGVSRAQLEALEDGDLMRFPDERSALAAVRRCADMAGLDADQLTPVVREHWRSGLVGATASPGAVGWAAPGTASGPLSTGHLSRFPGDRTDMQAFTTTAQTGRVVGNGEMLTGAYPAVQPLRIRSVRRRVPVLLRLALWLTLLLILVGVAGLAVHHWRPQWLVDIHVVQGPPGTAVRHGPAPPPPAPAPAPVTLTPTSANSAVMTVRAANFTVVAQGLQPAYIQVATPASFSPVFSGIVAAGERRRFSSANGQLSIQFGGAQILVAVEVNGRTVPSSLFKPSVVPFTLNFSSAS